MKILITGGGGFIGSFIAKRLLQLDHEVIILDNFNQYFSLKDLDQKYLKLRFLGVEDSLIFERGDITNKEEINGIIRKHKPSRIIHLGGVSTAIDGDDIDKTIRNTCLGTANILSVIKESSFVERFVYASSSMVYGNFTSEKVNEEHPLNPINNYGATKVLGENLTKIASYKNRMDYVIIRPSAVYGPTDINKRVSQIFLENAFLGRPLELFNKGEEKLDFTYVKDTTDGFIKATLDPKAKNQTFNITYGLARSLLEFAQILKEYFPKLEIKFLPENENIKRPKRGTLDITKARDILGYEPKYNLENGLKEYITFVKEHFNNKAIKTKFILNKINI